MQLDDDIAALREAINKVDEQLVKLLNQRAAIALRLGSVKAKSGKDVYDPDRERSVIEHVDGVNAGPLNKGAIEELFAAIITACRELQAGSLSSLKTKRL
jgi:chorismate mutase